MSSSPDVFGHSAACAQMAKGMGDSWYCACRCQAPSGQPTDGFDLLPLRSFLAKHAGPLSVSILSGQWVLRLHGVEERGDTFTQTSAALMNKLFASEYAEAGEAR